jgi:hypothetical protein
LRPVPDFAAAAAAYNASLIEQSASVAQELLALWAAMKVANLDASWVKVKPQALATVVKAQLIGAAAAYGYHVRLLAAAGLKPQGPQIRPIGFAGSSTGALDLATVVDFAPIRTKQAIARGLPTDQALQSGFAQLSTVAESELQEASRGVMDVALNTEPQYRGYLRTPNPGACGRCLILAGKFYRSDADFARHPGCRCSSRPLLKSEGQVETASARELFDGMTKEQQDKAFGIDGAEAIRAGADPSSTENAKAGMTSAGSTFTRAGLSKRSLSGRRLAAAGKTQRLSPAGCRKQANGDPDAYRAALRENGFIL